MLIAKTFGWLGILYGLIGIFSAGMILQAMPEAARACYFVGCFSTFGVWSGFSLLNACKEMEKKP